MSKIGPFLFSQHDYYGGLKILLCQPEDGALMMYHSNSKTHDLLTCNVSTLCGQQQAGDCHVPNLNIHGL